ncbi:MAG TPA: transcriptional regulator [Thermodesulforhabdus norvegica]|uniref:Transcriptional regulator n=1 Tax=Thermodesulforhabdus norvegica TaxID=39841 RepID=A0A7C1B0R9_9BACT|nr:transcriptional regulator [Thermodesulforhabdus norvegica]
MTEADIVLTPLPQADGIVKNRPALLLRQLPPFGDSDFPTSGLVADSVIRLGFLAVLPRQRILGSIGKIAAERHARLLRNLGEHLMANLKEAPNQAIDADTQ